MKVMKLLSILLALGLILCAFTACGEKKEPETETKNQEEVVSSGEEIKEEENKDRIPNPIVEYDSVEDAVIAVGHLSTLPTIYERYNKQASVISGTLIQIRYSDDSGEVLNLREERRPSGDISGVYNEYAYDKTIDVDGVDVNVRGDSGDSIVLVNWNDGAYAHSIFYQSGHTLEEVTDVVKEING